MNNTATKTDEILLDGKYRFVWNHSKGDFTCQRYDEAPRAIFDKSVLCLFFHALDLQEKVRELEMQLAESYRSEDLPDLVGSGETEE